MAADGSEVSQPMNYLHAKAEIRYELPQRTEGRVQATLLDNPRSSVVDVHPIRRRREKLAPVHRGVGAGDDRPRLRVRCRFIGEVPSVELFESGVDVLRVEEDGSCDPFVVVVLDDLKD